MKIDTMFRAYIRAQRRWLDAVELVNRLEGVYAGERLSDRSNRQRAELTKAVEAKRDRLQRQTKTFADWFMRKGYSATLNLSNEHQRVLTEKVKRLEAQTAGAQEFVRVLLFWHKLAADSNTPYLTFAIAQDRLLGACREYAASILESMQNAEG